MIGCDIIGGAVIATGALSTAGVIVVPQGLPLWKKLRHRPQQPTVEAAKAATANKIVSFLMIRFSAAIRARSLGRAARQ